MGILPSLRKEGKRWKSHDENDPSVDLLVAFHLHGFLLTFL